MAKAITKTVKSKGLNTPPFYKKYPLHLIVFLFPLLLFTNSVFNNYNMDDELVTRNHRLTAKGISAIPEIFTSPYYQDDMGYAYEYRPVPLSTFAIEHSIFGDRPFVSHVINLLLYCLLCLCLFRLLVSFGGELTVLAGLCITLLFCAHPSHTEVVCSIKNRDEILGLLFGVLAIQTALHASRKSSWWRLVLPVILFLLAMLCKTTFIPFAFFIPLAVILFTESSLIFTMFLAALLSLAAYMSLDINPPHLKMWLILLLLSGVAIAHLMVKGFSLIEVRSFFKNNEPVLSDPGVPFTGLKQWYAEFNIKSFFSLLPTAVILLLYLLAFMHSALSFLLVAIILLGTLFLNYKKSEYWNLSLGLLLVMTIIVLELLPYLGFAKNVGLDRLSQYQLISILLWILFFWGKDIVRLPALLLVLVITYYMADYRMVVENTGPLLTLLLSRVVIGRYVLSVIFLLELTAVVGTWQKALQPGPFYFFDFTPTINVVLLLMIFNWRNSWTYLVKKINVIMAGSVLLLSLFFISQFGSEVRNTVANSITSEKDYLNITKAVVKTPTDRPLQFVEFPLTPGSPLDLKLGTSLMILGHYLSKIAIPYPLSFYYGYAFIKPTAFKEAKPVIILVLHLLILLAAIFLIRRNKYISFGLVMYLLVVFMFSFYPVPGIVADRYLLVPSIGWSLVLTFILFKIWKLKEDTKNSDLKVSQYTQLPKGFRYSFTGLLGLYSLITFSRNFDWKDNLTLFRHDIKYVSNSAQANNLLAIHLMKYSFEITDPMVQKELRNEALGHFKSALEIYPSFYNVTFDLGRTYSSLSIPDSAIIYFKRAIAIDSSNSDAHLYVARLLVETNRNQEAIPYYEYRIRNGSSDYDPYGALSYIYYGLKEYEKSIEINTRAARQFPVLPDPLINIGRTYLAMNQPDSAHVYLRKALAVKPNNPDVIRLLQQLDNK